MNLTIIKNAQIIVTMDDDNRELKHGSIAFKNGQIIAVGDVDKSAFPEETNITIIDGRNCLVTPGLVNTHHHLSQTLTRAVPAAINVPLFDWLKVLYPIWSRYSPEDFYLAAQIGLSELVMSGCTLSSDHHYLYTNGAKLDDDIAAAQSVGIRFLATRGSMSIGESDGGLPPDNLVEKDDAILEDCIRLVDKFHDPSPGAMIQVGIAPCSPFSVSQDLMRESAILARDKGVRLHTHLAENDQDIEYSLEVFGCRPGEYAEKLGWVGPDVWHAHCVKLDDSEIDMFAAHKTGVAHCPCSNGRLASGIAPVRQMLDSGVPVGLGVDGSASSDSGHLLLEARQAMLMQRIKNGANGLTARESLRVATRGGAEILGRADCGQIAVGKRADIVLWDTTTLEMAGAWDPVAALVLCGPHTPKHVFIEGKAVVKDFNLTTLDLGTLARKAGKAVKSLIDV